MATQTEPTRVDDLLKVENDPRFTRGIAASLAAGSSVVTAADSIGILAVLSGNTLTVVHDSTDDDVTASMYILLSNPDADVAAEGTESRPGGYSYLNRGPAVVLEDAIRVSGGTAGISTAIASVKTSYGKESVSPKFVTEIPVIAAPSVTSGGVQT
jgi:hypothetical protein